MTNMNHLIPSYSISEDESRSLATENISAAESWFENQTRPWFLQHGIVWEMDQPWSSIRESAFSPGQVFLGRTEDQLCIMADLNDPHVMRNVFPFNYPAFGECDAFEIFLGIEGAEPYYEFHVTPSNSIFQLYFAGGNNGSGNKGSLVPAPLFSSQSWNNPKGWGTLCCLPIHALFPKSSARLQMSFGRYDYPPDRHDPVISTSSRHSVCDFHRRNEWKLILFEEIPLLPPSKIHNLNW